MPKLASDKLCTGCLACYDSCNHQAVDIVMKNGLVHVNVDAEKCIGCNLCERSCPIVTPVRKNELSQAHVYGGWATDEEMRVNGASGGAFTGLAHSFFHLHKGEPVVVIGASLANNRVSHIVVDDEKELFKLANSKYIQSDTGGIYRVVRERLGAGYWVLFSGCPCQVAALYGVLGTRRDNKRLITVEVVCHGIAGQEALDLHLHHYNSNRIYSFRDKHLGTQNWEFSQCTTIEIDGHPHKLARKQDVFYAIYSGWLLDRKSCSNCQYASIERVADISLADFWGLSVPEYYKQGVSLIMTNNMKADAFVKAADNVYVFKEALTTAIGGNPHLFTGYKFIKYHPMVVAPEIMKKILPASLRFAILTNRMPHKLFWAIFKIATMLHIKYQKNKLIRRLYNDKSLSHLLIKPNRG
jgi:coenzyme F420-reducing hydrogenase beta subunit